MPRLSSYTDETLRFLKEDESEKNPIYTLDPRDPDFLDEIDREGEAAYLAEQEGIGPDGMPIPVDQFMKGFHTDCCGACETRREEEDHDH